MQKKYFLLAFLVVFFCLSHSTIAAQDGLIAWWRFDQAEERKCLDFISQVQDEIVGPIKSVAGVSGKALRFDGFRSFIVRKADQAPALSGPFTIEVWAALGAYPWFWGPIIDNRDPFRGFMFGIDNQGHFGFRLMAEDRWQDYRSKGKLPLREWIHLAGVYDPEQGISLYQNGKLKGTYPVEGLLMPTAGGPLFIGRNYDKEDWRAGNVLKAVGYHSFFDGIMDELKIHKRALTAEEVERHYASVRPAGKPDLPERVFPKVHKETAPFGAYYTKLNYYDEWDALWCVSDVADVLLCFDEMNGRLVFWRGASFVPCWVTENGIWFTHEWLETWGKDVCSCAEPIMDKDCRFSHVRIIESHDARAVVHWRYALADAYYTFAAVDDDGRGEWADEFYIIYPDGVGIRKMLLHYSRPMRRHDWAEQIVLLPPGQFPQDVIKPPEITLVNMRGQEHSYSWGKNLPLVLREPEGANIEIVNLKSKYKPFLIVSPNPFESVEVKSNSPFFRTFRAEMGKYRPAPVPTVYGWWKHWPIAQVPGDGFWVLSPDRASHFNLTTYVQWEDYEVTNRVRTRIMLHGLTDKSPAELVPLAKSWLHAPILKLNSSGFESRGYDLAQRAYVLERKSPGEPSSLNLTLEARESTPLINPAFVLRNWGKAEARLTVNGKPVKRGKDFRLGHHSTLEGTHLVVWIKLESMTPVQISIQPTAR